MGEKEKLSDLYSMKGGETEDAEEKHNDDEPALPPEAMVMSGPMLLLLAMSGFIALLQQGSRSVDVHSPCYHKVHVDWPLVPSLGFFWGYDDIR